MQTGQDGASRNLPEETRPDAEHQETGITIYMPVRDLYASACVSETLAEDEFSIECTLRCETDCPECPAGGRVVLTT